MFREYSAQLSDADDLSDNDDELKAAPSLLRRRGITRHFIYRKHIFSDAG